MLDNRTQLVACVPTAVPGATRPAEDAAAQSDSLTPSTSHDRVYGYTWHAVMIPTKGDIAAAHAPAPAPCSCCSSFSSYCSSSLLLLLLLLLLLFVLLHRKSKTKTQNAIYEIYEIFVALQYTDTQITWGESLPYIASSTTASWGDCCGACAWRGTYRSSSSSSSSSVYVPVVEHQVLAIRTASTLFVGVATKNGWDVFLVFIFVLRFGSVREACCWRNTNINTASSGRL